MAVHSDPQLSAAIADKLDALRLDNLAVSEQLAELRGTQLEQDAVKALTALRLSCVQLTRALNRFRQASPEPRTPKTMRLSADYQMAKFVIGSAACGKRRHRLDQIPLCSNETWRTCGKGSA